MRGQAQRCNPRCSCDAARAEKDQPEPFRNGLFTHVGQSLLWLSEPPVAKCPVLTQVGGLGGLGPVEVEFECPMVKSLLIVDDDPAQRRILEEMIKRLGFNAKTASSGEQALQLLEGPERSEICLVLLDLVMGLDILFVCGQR